MSLKYKNKGSVTFVFYFIVAIALLAIAGYYIGINEQTKLFKAIAEKKQQQDDAILNSLIVEQGGDALNLSNIQDAPIKSLIDSPLVVLNNIKNSNDSIRQAGGAGNNGLSSDVDSASFNVAVGPDLDINSQEIQSILEVAKDSTYFVKSNENKNGVLIKLSNGEAKGDGCYNTQSERVCFPQYKLEKIWAVGDLNNDKKNDAIISISALGSLSPKDSKINNFYIILSDDVIVPFNYGIHYPKISSVEINDGLAVLIGNFYTSSDVLGDPSSNKVIKYKVEVQIDNVSPDLIATSSSTEVLAVLADEGQGSNATSSNYVIKKFSEARLFKEQGESTSSWYPYNYTFDGLDFSFKAPELWQKEESFNKTVRIVFKNSDGRSIVLETGSIVETCSEYNFNLKDASNVNIKDSEFIDLGLFGVGSYIKYTIISEGINQYHADICVTDKNNDKKMFGLYSSTKEDETPYFAIFDKIWSTFKVSQND